ncbi:phosphopantetheine-binding protein [Candidatus Allofournierella excrementavium]|uniref:phosphopantetheine-binding protein n=1 Tax=Candidatus Allofournierella excrementavium TaxID=2838591 RepID=UPI003AEF970F
MNEAQFENQVRCLLAEACGSAAALREGVDLLESGLLDSLAFITLLDGLEDMGVEIQPTQVEREAFRTAAGIVELCKTFARKAGVVV